MKARKTHLYWIMYSFVLIACTSCLGYKELPVEYDYNYNGNFKKYRTFEIMASTLGEPFETNEVIEKSIISRMKFLGYNRSVKRPHLLIAYRIFNDSLSYRGYNQPELENFLKTYKNNLDYTPTHLDLRSGTLAIYFIDYKYNRTVWQGYAVGLSNSMDYTSTRQLRNAVISILDQYRVWADGFLENSQQVIQVQN